jgi:hypothetical protein
MTMSLALDFARALDPTLIAKDVGLDRLDEWQAKLIDDPPEAASLLLWSASRQIDCGCGLSRMVQPDGRKAAGPIKKR